MEKRYSILMSVYHKEKPEYLQASIESMINQTLPPSDYVIVKDGELTKELDKLISFYKNAYPNLFNIVALKNNVGLGKALDEGMKYCKYELIARMDSDDISLPTRCEKQVDLFSKHPEYSIIGTMIDEFYDDPNQVVSSRVVPTEHDDILEFIRRRNPFNHPTVMYKKNDVLSCGGYGGIPTRQDLDLFSRMLNSGYKAINIDESLLLFRANEDNFLRRKSWKYCKGYIDVRYRIWKRGHCSLSDLVIGTLSQLAMLVSPTWFLKRVSNKYLRESA